MSTELKLMLGRRERDEWARWQCLPRLAVRWLEDAPRRGDCQTDRVPRRDRSPITQPGYRAGCKPGNYGKLRHALAVSLAREGVPMHLIQRQLGHSNLGTTATYLSGIAPFEVVNAMTARPAPEES